MEFGDGHAKEEVHDQGQDWLGIGEQSQKAASGSLEQVSLQLNSLGFTFAMETDGPTTSNSLLLESGLKCSLATTEIQSLDFGSEKSQVFEHCFGEGVFAAHPEVTLDEAILHFE